MMEAPSRKQHWLRLRGVFRACFYDQSQRKLSPAGAEPPAPPRHPLTAPRSAFSTDALRMAYQVGQHDVLRHIMQILELDDEKIARLDQVALIESATEGFGSDGQSFT